jgi:cell division protein FtsQ
MTKNPAVRLFWTALTGIACFAGFLLVVRHYNRWMDSSGTFLIRRIEIEGNDLVPEKDVLKRAAVRKRGNIWEVDLGGVEKRIEADPLIRNAVVARYFPDVLTIRVDEKKPLALLNAGGRLFAVDSGGVVLPARAGKLYELPVVTSASPESASLGRTVRDESVLKCLGLVKLIMAERPDLYTEISEVAAGQQGGLIVYTRQEGIPVRMGRDEFEIKIRILEALIKQWEARSGGAKIDYVDLRFNGQVVLGMGA